MLSQAAAIEAVAKGLDRHRAKNIVLDPVMVATSGDRLLAADAVAALRGVAYPACAGRDAQSAGSSGACWSIARRAIGSRNGRAGARVAGSWRAIRADQRRPRRRAGERRSAGRGRTSVTPFCRNAHRHQEHARHRLHAVVGDRRRARQRSRPQSRGAGRQSLCHRSHRRRRQCSGSATATGRCIIFMQLWSKL